MRSIKLAAPLAFLVLLAGCAASSPQSAMGDRGVMRSDAAPAAHQMTPVWADPEFIKS